MRYALTIHTLVHGGHWRATCHRQRSQKRSGSTFGTNKFTFGSNMAWWNISHSVRSFSYSIAHSLRVFPFAMFDDRKIYPLNILNKNNPKNPKRQIRHTPIPQFSNATCFTKGYPVWFNHSGSNSCVTQIIMAREDDLNCRLKATWNSLQNSKETWRRV